MKKPLLVIVEFINPASNQEAFLKLIKTYGQWARINGLAYIVMVESVTNTVQHRDYLVKPLVLGDKIYVTELGKAAAWAGLTDEVSNWIKQNQG